MQIRTLCAAAALLAAPCAVMAQAYRDNTTIGNVASVQVGKTSANTAATYLDIEGPGNGKYETYGLIDFGSIYYAPFQGLQDNTLDLNLSDSPYNSVPGSVDIALVTSPVSNPAALLYATQPASINLPVTASYYAAPGTLNYNLLPPGNNYISAGSSGNGGNYNYTVTLSPAALSYFDSVLNNPNGDLQLLVTADATTPNIYTGFYGGVFPSATSPYIGFNSVPEPSAALSLLMGVSAVGLLGARRRKR